MKKKNVACKKMLQRDLPREEKNRSKREYQKIKVEVEKFIVDQNLL